MDIVHPWTLDEAGNELLPITTFSIAMAHRQSGGKLAVFVEGLRALRKLQAGDKVLISEACNHNRITDNCNDIGMVQIPNFVHKLCGPQVGGWVGGEQVSLLLLAPVSCISGRHRAPLTVWASHPLHQGTSKPAVVPSAQRHTAARADRPAPPAFPPARRWPWSMPLAASTPRRSTARWGSTRWPSTAAAA